MRKFFALAGLIAALAIPAVAAAATLHTAHVGLGCSGGGSFHFVNNQTGGILTPAVLTANFTGGTVVATADHVTPGTQHWTIDGTGTLLGTTSTTLPGKLVLSDFECDAKKPKK